MKLSKREIIIMVISLLLIVGAYFAGYAVGFSDCISWGVKVASHFVNFTIDQDLLSKAIYQYQNNIGACFP